MFREYKFPWAFGFGERRPSLIVPDKPVREIVGVTNVERLVFIAENNIDVKHGLGNGGTYSTRF